MSPAKQRLQPFNRGKWEVERERCRLTDPRPPSPPATLAPMEDVVPKLMQQLGLADRHWESVLTAEWSELVGADVARHARPGRLYSGVLTIFVKNSVWLHELGRFGKSRIEANLKTRFGPHRIRAVRLQLDPDGGGRPPRRRPPRQG